MDIGDWRLKIDEIDSEILNLLNKRAKFSIEIGKIKKLQRLPIHSPKREKFIIERVLRENRGPLQSDGIRHIFERIIDESRHIERERAQMENAILKGE